MAENSNEQKCEPSHVKDKQLTRDILACISNAVDPIGTSPSKQDWLIFTELFPSVVDAAAVLLDEGEIFCLCNSPHLGSFFRISLGSDINTVFSKTNFCTCRFGRSTEEHEKTCEHVLASAIAEHFKMVDITAVEDISSIDMQESDN